MNSKNELKENKFMYDDLIAKLREGVAKVKFTKKDGTERVMSCTLNVEYMPMVEFAKDQEASKKEPNKEVVKCWDTEKEAWRSFRVDSVLDVRV
jgi:hypothetical protein